ncbi:hypothetical protein MRX96_055838 [Rhipicephalus microplus]
MIWSEPTRMPAELNGAHVTVHAHGDDVSDALELPVQQPREHRQRREREERPYFQLGRDSSTAAALCMVAPASRDEMTCLERKAREMAEGRSSRRDTYPGV